MDSLLLQKYSLISNIIKKMSVGIQKIDKNYDYKTEIHNQLDILEINQNKR